MDNINIKLHDYQKLLLGKLVKQPSARFHELMLKGFESEHMNYHLQKLIEFGLVQKIGNEYSLTDKGKDYSNLMDDGVEFIEKQPKTSVLLTVVRKNPETGQIEHLLSKRLRQPYFGKVGRLTGKVRFGETLQQAAERELYEETGLKAKTIVLEEIYHKLRHREDGTFVQDVLFYTFFMKDVEGEFITRTDYQENLWLSSSDLKDNKDIDLFEDLKLIDRFEPKDFHFVESVKLSEGY